MEENLTRIYRLMNQVINEVDEICRKHEETVENYERELDFCYARISGLEKEIKKAPADTEDQNKINMH